MLDRAWSSFAEVPPQWAEENRDIWPAASAWIIVRASIFTFSILPVRSRNRRPPGERRVTKLYAIARLTCRRVYFNAATRKKKKTAWTRTDWDRRKSPSNLNRVWIKNEIAPRGSRSRAYRFPTIYLRANCLYNCDDVGGRCRKRWRSLCKNINSSTLLFSFSFFLFRWNPPQVFSLWVKLIV